MITDFCASLSRKAKDKLSGTGRFHIIKNRYGLDGLTFGAKINTSVGDFEIHEYDAEDMEAALERNQNQNQGDYSNYEKKYLKEQFFNLNP